ncbi:hypothetical protein K2O51_26505 [Cupriavidus pinatubonensis]|uniref:HNH endonuclease n=1 Tax=Cupriavidus pinatubonensis TaxID=248026 RepID=UPI001C73275A|nr:hypothetical protein [Cupriavidus pinatubonensis]QYY30862.1 hypothetical protein K2O51_26505 [Cupriavidus pinatubonensis]
MNKLPRPPYDDAVILQKLTQNKRLKSYPHLQSQAAMLHLAYAQYEAVAGNVHHVNAVPIGNAIADYLRSHYESPGKDLAHIEAIRAEHEHRTCPMCGSFHSGTLDHVLPQADYPAFALFSRNLVPACKCNSKRGNIVAGAANERILHPYFDHCLTERLIRADFSDLGAVPGITLQLCIDGAHPYYAPVAFHAATIVGRSAILRYLRDRWLALCRRPSLAVRALVRNPATEAALRRILSDELELLDDEHGSKNNWNSAFIAGVMEPHVVTWLYQRMHAPGRASNAPLL